MPRQRKQLDIEERHLWYLVGLVATDGCLSSDGRHIDITAKEYNFLDSVRRSLKIENKIASKFNGKGQRSWHIQISNKNLYELFVKIGLKPRKSLTLGHLNIPGHGFVDFLRGVIDGDGGVRRWVHPSNGCEQWVLRIYSAAPIFSAWIKNAVETWFEVKGCIHKDASNFFTIKFGKLAARRILGDCYYDGCLAMTRKFALAISCIESAVLWSKSKTVAAAA